MKIVKTWCENTKEGESYLEYSNYGKKVKRIPNTNLFLCLGNAIPNKCKDVEIIISLP